MSPIQFARFFDTYCGYASCLNSNDLILSAKSLSDKIDKDERLPASPLSWSLPCGLQPQPHDVKSSTSLDWSLSSSSSSAFLAGNSYSHHLTGRCVTSEFKIFGFALVNLHVLSLQFVIFCKLFELACLFVPLALIGPLLSVNLDQTQLFGVVSRWWLFGCC